ncbi:MAG TPA: HAD family phosphatase [Vicinamibacterales bacterium]
MKLATPEGPFSAYLFDCDGTIADSMPLHYKAWCQALGEWNCVFSEQDFYAWGGMPVREIIERLAREQGLELPVIELAERKESLYFSRLAELMPVPAVVEHIHAQHGRLPMAVVSGSTRECVEKSLDALGLLDRFDAVVCAEDYTNSKPHPEPFLVAAERLGVAPDTCLVFEDTDMGIEAARAAGMQWVRVPAPWERG